MMSRRIWFGVVGLLVCVSLAKYMSASASKVATVAPVVGHGDASAPNSGAHHAVIREAPAVPQVSPEGVVADASAKPNEGEKSGVNGANEDVDQPNLGSKPSSEEAFNSAEELLVAIRDRGKIAPNDMVEFVQLQRQMNLADVTASTKQLRELMHSRDVDTSALRKNQ